MSLSQAELSEAEKAKSREFAERFAQKVLEEDERLAERRRARRKMERAAKRKKGWK